VATRDELFVGTKLWQDDYADPEAALRLSLKKLRLDYVDLYMIHWPHNGVGPVKVPMHKLWPMMESLVAKGLTKSIGVSNFNIQLLADMLTYCKIRPAVNQIQLYPECAQTELCSWLQS
jgi:diketogulonate reductase-like aldo/keto reductase